MLQRCASLSHSRTVRFLLSNELLEKNPKSTVEKPWTRDDIFRQHLALMHGTDKNHSDHLWADTICIDQTDTNRRKKIGRGTAISSALFGLSFAAGTCMVNFENSEALPNFDRHIPAVTELYFYKYWSKPTATIFVGATIIQGLATYGYYLCRSKDRYKEHFLGIGGLAAIGTGILTGHDARGILTSIIPLTLIASLLLCTVCNVCWNCCYGRGLLRNHHIERDARGCV
jgi:hypothetical protein